MIFPLTIAAITVNALFYIHFEIILEEESTKKSNVLDGIHIVGINVDRIGTMMIKTNADLAGTRLLSIFTEETSSPNYPAIMDSFI